MKKLRVLYYVMRQSLRNIARNLFMVFASVIVVFFVLLVVGVFIEAGLTMGNVIQQYSDRPEVQVNFYPKTPREEVDVYFKTIQESPLVKEARIITEEENLESLLESFKDQKGIYERYSDSENLRFFTIEVQLNDYVDGKSFVETMKEIPEVETVMEVVGIVEKMELAKFWINVGTIIAVIVMTGLSLLLIFNTVKLTVLARHREIEIMKYIGATDVYIVTPFVIEGVATGIVGALISFVTLSAVYSSAMNALKSIADSSKIVLRTFGQSGGFVIFVCFVLFGALMGFIASIFAARRYMKV